MLKILYAASNNDNAKITLSRFIKHLEGKPYIIKIAAYKKSSPPINIDWTLDCLLNIFNTEKLILHDNDNFSTYFEQVKYYAPDLIISDLEHFTSYIANTLNIPLWQCSSSLINYAVASDEKYNLGLFKKYSYLTNRDPINTQRIVNIIDNSNYNLVYSHLGDLTSPPKLKSNFEWIRPYHTVGKHSIPCQHNIVAGIPLNNKKIFSLLKKSSDSIVFSNFIQEKYLNVSLKNYNNQEEYFCNLKNCKLFLCEGQTSFLADAYYNNKYSIILTNFNDLECVTNSVFSEKNALSSCVYDLNDDISKYQNNFITSSYNKEIKFLHEKLEEFY